MEDVLLPEFKKPFFSSHLMADFCVWHKSSSCSNSARLLTVSLLHHPSVSVQMSDPTHTLVHCIFYFLEEAVSIHVMLRGLGTFGFGSELLHPFSRIQGLN